MHPRPGRFPLPALVIVSVVQLCCSNPAWHTTYEDEKAGFSVGLPIGWTPVSSDIVARFELDADETIRSDPPYTPSEVEIAIANFTAVAIFSPHDWNSAQPQFPMLAVGKEPWHQMETVPEYLTAISDSLSTSLERVGDPERMRCNGRHIDYLEFEARIDQTPMYAHLYGTRHGEYILSFHAIAFQREELDLMRSMVCSTHLF